MGSCIKMKVSTTFQFLIGTVQPVNAYDMDRVMNIHVVSIPHRYGITTDFLMVVGYASHKFI